MKTKSYTFFLFSVLFALGCKQTPSLDQKILGTWETSVFIDQTKSSELFGEMDDGMSMEMTISTNEQYLRANRYNADAEMTMRIYYYGEETSLNFLMRDAGTWEIHDNEVITISDGANISALDEDTEFILQSDPQFAESMTPIKGQSSSSRILEIAEDHMMTESDDLPGLVFSYKRVN